MARSPSFYFTVAMILLFALSLFGVILSVPNAGNAQDGAPTPNPESFKGFGAGSARVSSLGNQLIVQCGSPSPDAVDAIQAIPGVATAFKPGSDLIVVVANASFDVGETSQQVAATAVSRCTGLRILRAALIDFAAPVQLVASSSDSASRGNRTLYPLEARGYGLQTANLAGVPAYLDAISTRANDTVLVVVSATYSGEQITELVAEQQGIGEITDTPPIEANATGNLTGDGVGSNESIAGNGTVNGNVTNGSAASPSPSATPAGNSSNSSN